MASAQNLCACRRISFSSWTAPGRGRVGRGFCGSRLLGRRKFGSEELRRRSDSEGRCGPLSPLGSLHASASHIDRRRGLADGLENSLRSRRHSFCSGHRQMGKRVSNEALTQTDEAEKAGVIFPPLRPWAHDKFWASTVFRPVISNFCLGSSCLSGCFSKPPAVV